MEKSDKLKVIKNICLALFLGSAFFACVGDVGSILLTEHANRLLSRDGIKIWNRVERMENGQPVDISGDCEDNQGLAFYNLEQAEDTVYRLTQLFDCGESDTLVLFKANYDVLGNVDDEFTDKILFFNEDTSHLLTMQVLDLTSRYLRVKYDEGENEVEEIFTFDLE